MRGNLSTSAPGAVLGALLALGCGGGGGSTNPPGGGGDLAAQLETLQGAAIYFGHNSVGSNMVEGLYALVGENAGPEPTIVGTSDPAQVSAGVFAHSGIGGNGDPAAKIATFRTLMTGALGGKVDVGFMKFCFVDFETAAWDSQANVDALFADYQAMVAAVHTAHPTLKLVHLTVPLSPADDANNARRERVSQKLRAAYGSDVFDLALLESTNPTTQQRVMGTGSNGPRLYSGWASDGSGHLNAAGSRAVAQALVAFLAGKL
jgi:hypothetical protein